jgi:hypothetical protein
MRTHDGLFNPKRQLQTIRRELQTNRSTLNELFDCYRMFLFTGGTIPLTRWDLAAIASYIERPCATDRIMLDDVVRYRHLAEAIQEVGKEVSASGPKSLRKRHGFTDTFRGLFLDIRALGRALDASVTNALTAPLASRPVTQARPAVVEAKSTDSVSVPLVSTGEQRQISATSEGSAEGSPQWPIRAEEEEMASMLVARRQGQGQRRHVPYRAPSDSEARWLDDGGQG